MDISTTADRAADYLVENGHAKGKLQNPYGNECCLGGALLKTVPENLGINLTRGQFTIPNNFTAIVKAVEDMIGATSFVQWNNAPERKPEEVIQVLRDVATKHRGDAMTVTGGE